MREEREEIPITIFVRDGGRPVAPLPPALPKPADNMPAGEFIRVLRARRTYEDAVTDAANGAFDKHFRKAAKTWV